MFMSYESKQEFIMATGPDHKEEIRNLNPHELIEQFINDVDLFDFLFDISTKDDELYELSTLFLKDDKYTTKMIMNVDDCGLLRVIKVVITNGKTCTLTDLSSSQELNIYIGLHFAITILSHYSHVHFACSFRTSYVLNKTLRYEHNVHNILLSTELGSSEGIAISLLSVIR